MNKKLWIIIGIVVVVAIFIFANLTLTSSNAIKVKTEAVKARDIIEIVSASGRIQPQTKVDITSEINGEIIGLMVKEGDRVEIGDLLVVLDTVQLRTDFDQAHYAVNEINARLEGARTTLEQNEEEFKRQEKLFASNLTSDKAFKDAKYAYLNSKASYEATLAQSQQYQSRYEKQLDYLSKTKIRAPMGGVVTYLDCEVGEIAAAQTSFTQGKTLMTIANLAVYEVEVEVDETEIAKVRLDQEAEIEVDALPDTTFAGRVVEIGNTAILAGSGTTDQSTNFKVKVVFSDPHVDIRPGMSATVDITTNRRENVTTVPFASVVMRSFDVDSLEHAREGNNEIDEEEAGPSEVHAAENDEEMKADDDGEEAEREEIKGVFVQKDGKATFVEVETGIADQKYIEISTGLSESDTVISGPYRVLRTLKEGEEVEATNDKKKGNG